MSARLTISWSWRAGIEREWAHDAFFKNMG
jgi:hypothetical protein